MGLFSVVRAKFFELKKNIFVSQFSLAGLNVVASNSIGGLNLTSNWLCCYATVTENKIWCWYGFFVNSEPGSTKTFVNIYD